MSDDGLTGVLGRIHKYYTIWCGTCVEWEDVPEARTVAGVARYARKHGWTKSKEYGWCCPKCSAASRGGVTDGVTSQ